MEKLIEVLSIQTESYNQWRMFAYIIRQIRAMDDVDLYVKDGNIYATKGIADKYPCVVAHMDTVHDIEDDLTPVVIDGKITGINSVTMEQIGIGGDDKVGVFIALECLREFDNIKVAFFRDEEVGCDGSSLADMSFFKDCRFVLQADRRGCTDFIINASGVELSSKFFQDEVEVIVCNYGYKFGYGMMTDVMQLKENGIECSVANVSCGYYNPHTAQEYVVIDDVMNCLEMFKTIILYCTDDYVHKYKPRVYTPVTYTSVKYKPGKWTSASKPLFNEWEDFYNPALQKKKKPDADGNTVDLCEDCYGDVPYKNNLCTTCHDWYNRDNIDNFKF